MPTPSIQRAASFHAAIGLLLQNSSYGEAALLGVYTITDIAGYRPQTREDVTAELNNSVAALGHPPSPELAAALLDLAMDNPRAALYSIDSEAHLGYVLVHYSVNSDPLSFHAVHP